MQATALELLWWFKTCTTHAHCFQMQLADEAAINGALILPHKAIKDSIYTPGTIVM